MSWKIYNGFIFSNISSLDDVYDYCVKIKDKFNNIADTIWANNILDLAVYEFDKSMYTNVKLQKSPILYAIRTINDIEEQSLKNKEKSFTNIGMQLNFCPTVINRKQKIVGIAFIDNRMMQKSFFDDPEILDFSYWNNSDKPDDISSKNWNLREKVWNNVFFHNDKVSDVMLSFQLVNDGLRLGINYEEHFEKNIPSIEYRVESLAKSIVYDKLSESNFIEKMKDLKSPESIQMYNDEKEKISQKLEKNLTFEMLLKKDNE